MFNHARTLLINLSGTGSYFANVPGDELTPSSFLSLELPTYLDTCRANIFGATPDRAMLNYRAAQLLTIIESTDLQEFVLSLDSRITYKNSGEFLADDSLFKPTVRQISGSSANYLSLLGGPSYPDDSGVCGFRYDIEVTSLVATVNRLTTPTTVDLTSLVLSGGLSQAVTLPSSGYKFRLHPDGDSSWTVRGFNRPQRPLADIETSLKSIGEPNLVQLFGVTNEEPYLTFKNCWYNHPELAYRLGGFVLAMIYRSNEIYALQGGK
jgi:hypothetical protein